MTSASIPPAESPEDVADDLAAMSDEELVSALRGGQDRAYELLWIRHVAAARRAARRLAPMQAEDLVSEAFLTIYEQIRTRGKGPTSAFRAYLFAVIRNIAARWHRENALLVNDPDADVVSEDENLRNLEREYDGAILLDAFRALPDRWQRVLWLSEIQDVSRPVIAAELGIRPNAVSALHRRARSGLRVQWLLHQVPADLRADPDHVAAALPETIVGGSVQGRLALASHLGTCERCRALEMELRAAYRDGKKSAASVGGLAALGVVLPAASALWAAPVTITVAAGVGFGFASVAAVLIGALGLGLGLGAITRPVAPGDAIVALPLPDATHRPVVDARPEPSLPSPTPTPAATGAPLGPPSTPPPVEEIDIFLPGPDSDGFPVRPAPEAPADPSTVTPPSQEPAAPPAPAVMTATPSSAYLAPVFSGDAPPGTDISVGIGDDVYRTAATQEGTWSFDARSVALSAGTYTATVWSVVDGVASGATDVLFTIEPLILDGFMDYPSVTLREGMDAGIRFTMIGAPGGAVCVDSDNGQSTLVPLDASGRATRILRFYNYGIYLLRLTPCDGDFYGPDLPRNVSVNNGLFDPWVLDDVMYWELTEE
ncbi:RNA polymerase sigma factor [Microbacterium tumbae]